MTIRSKTLAILVVVLIFGGIMVSSALGFWQTESTKQAAVYTSGEFAGEANPADIRGSYTFGDVERNFAVPAALLVQAFGVETADPAAFQVKSLEEIYSGSPVEVGTASVRLFVALYKGLPFDLGSDIYVPESAAAVLREINLTADQAAYLESHTAPNLASGEVQPAQPPAKPQEIPQSAQPVTPASTPHVEGSSTPPDGQVRGKTTFAELLEWGLPAETVEHILGAPMPPTPGMTVKDYCTQQGLSFEEIKTNLQAEVDMLK